LEAYIHPFVFSPTLSATVAKMPCRLSVISVVWLWIDFRSGAFIPYKRGKDTAGKVSPLSYGWVAMSCSKRKLKSIAPFRLLRMKTPSHQSDLWWFFI